MALTNPSFIVFSSLVLRDCYRLARPGGLQAGKNSPHGGEHRLTGDLRGLVVHQAVHKAVDDAGLCLVVVGLNGLCLLYTSHAGHPEADDVIGGDQGVGGIEIGQVLGLLGPAQGADCLLYTSL